MHNHVTTTIYIHPRIYTPTSHMAMFYTYTPELYTYSYTHTLHSVTFYIYTPTLQVSVYTYTQFTNGDFLCNYTHVARLCVYTPITQGDFLVSLNGNPIKDCDHLNDLVAVVSHEGVYRCVGCENVHTIPCSRICQTFWHPTNWSPPVLCSHTNALPNLLHMYAYMNLVCQTV